MILISDSGTAQLVKYKQSLFIYDRREMIVIFLMVFMMSVFTFTLGIHYGKRVQSRSSHAELADTSKVSTLLDQLPSKQEFVDHSNGAQHSLEETLSQELHDEVIHTQIKLNPPRQIDLPINPKNKNEGATTLGPSRAQVSPGGENYTLQIGSYPSLEIAKKQLGGLIDPKLKPFLREANIKGKGKWYRLYTGKFLTRIAAEQAGEQYRSQHKISSFIAVKTSE